MQFLNRLLNPRESDSWDNLLLDENFDKIDRIDSDSKVWNYETKDPTNFGWGNGEIQTYTEQNAFIDDKKLHVQLRKGRDGRWTSSRLTTKGKFEFQYGRVDVRLKTNRVDGVWPAVWCLSSRCGAEGGRRVDWPMCGELDIFEMQTAWEGYIPSTVHCDLYNGAKDNAKSYKDTNTNTSGFRLYSMDWTPDYVAFFHDGWEVGRYENDGGGASSWPFGGGNKFYLVVNNAMYPGGLNPNPSQRWGSKPSPNLQSHDLVVDYIKVWQYPR